MKSEIFARWLVVGMTGTVAGVTIYLAANGGGPGQLITGTALAIFGVFVYSLYLRPE